MSLGDENQSIRYQYIFEMSPFAIMTVSLRGIVTSCNPATTELTEYSKEEIIGKHIINLPYFDRDTTKIASKVLADIALGKPWKDIEFPYITKSGKKRMARGWVQLIQYPNNQREGIAIIEDITEQILAAREITEREKRLSDFINNALNGFSILDDNMRYLAVNDVELENLNKTREDVIGKHILEINPALAETERYKGYLKVLETGEPVEYKQVLMPRYGRTFDFYAFKSADTLGIVSKDVTFETHYEHSLEALHNHVSSLAHRNTLEEIADETMNIIHNVLGFQIGSFGIVEHDKIVFTAFREQSSIFELDIDGPGLTVKAVKTKQTQLVKDTRESQEYISGRAMDDNETLSELDVPIILDDKVVALINLESNYVNGFAEEDQRVVELLAQHVSSRLTSLQMDQMRIRAETAEELDRLKTRFVSTATHELRTPLTIMKGYLELALEEKNIDTLHHLLKVAYRNTERLESLTNDLLDQQRIEEGKLELIIKPVQLDVMISEISEETSALLSERNQKLCIIKPDEPIVLECDPIRLNQVLLNLLSNASKYSLDETIITLVVEEADNQVKFSIKDQGYGITPEEIPKLFKPFPDIKRPVLTEQSIGLGLSISKGIVMLHKGRIWATSNGRQKGTTFTFTIPRTQ